VRNKVKRNRLVVAMIKRHPGGTRIRSNRDKERDKKFDWRKDES